MGQTTSSLQPPEGLEAVTLADVRRAVVVHRKRLGGAVLLSARQAQQLLQPGLKDDEARAVEAAIKRWFGGWFKGPDGRTVDRVGGNLVLGALACVANADATPGDEGAVRARATALFAVLAAGATHLDADHVALRLDGASRALARVETGGKRCREDGERHFIEVISSPDYLGAQVVFWDGAELRHDSYTSVLPALAARGCKLAAWRAGASEAQKKLLASSWACVDACDAVVALFDDKSPRVGETVSGDAPQPRHASKAALNCLKLIHYAGVSRVVCFGGGQDVLDLVDNAPGHVEFHVIPAVRCADNGADGVFGTDDDEFEEAHVLAYGGKNAQRVHVYQLNG